MTDDRRLHPGERDYPELLARVPDPPSSLHVRGGLIREDILSVAVVGSRTPTPYGRHMARLISGNLAARGVTVVSGLARGIDTAAHEAALDRGGRTVAVLGCGMDIDYPRGSKELKSRIAGHGAIITEFDPGTPPRPGNFPTRNRIISGLSLGVVVVQAGLQSGSLITARWALDQGREVMAVPGRADDPLSAGPVALLRDGASPACSAEDILEILGLKNLVCYPPPPVSGSSGDDPILNALQTGPHLPEELAETVGVPLPRILSELTRLELEGLVIHGPGGRFSLK